VVDSSLQYFRFVYPFLYIPVLESIKKREFL